MHIAILGGTGFVGTALVKTLVEQGDTVTILCRGCDDAVASQLTSQNPVRRIAWDGHRSETLAMLLENADALINLQGENIAAGRWTPARKQAIVQSRTQAGNAICAALRLLATQGRAFPHTLIHASACGYYGIWEDARSAPLCNERSPSGWGFLAETCVSWEQSHREAEELGVRRCVLRFAPILGKNQNGAPGGLLARMVPPFRAFVGGAPGTGRQPFAWVHLEDVICVITFLLKRDTLNGVFNVCAPQEAQHAVTAQYMADCLGQVLRRPSHMPVPSSLLRLGFGEMADELLLAGQRVDPERLRHAEFVFRFPTLHSAVENILG